MQPNQNRKSDKTANEENSFFNKPSKIIKIKYFTCNKGKDHEGEVLNIVCIKKDCQKHGLLCSMCKAEHQNHTTIPLKLLLSKLQNHRQKPLESSQEFQSELSELEEIHKKMLLNLRGCVQNLAQRFKQIQLQINEEFSKAKIQLLERVQVNMKFNTFIEDAIQNRCEDRQEFIQDIARISSMIEVKGEVEDFKKQSQIKFSANFGMVVETLKKLEKQLFINLEKIQKFVLEGEKLMKYEDIKNISQKNKNPQPQANTKPNQQAFDFPLLRTFSSIYKSPSIILQQNTKTAKQSKTGEGRFVFTNIQITAPFQKAAFKIKSLKNWIGLGVGIRQKLKFMSFKFEYNNLGHGSYLISSNGYSWSHTQQSNNISVVGFKFVLNDVVQIQYEKTKLKFWNRNSNEKYQLKVAFNQVEEKDIFFCANLCSEGDSVEIVDILP